MFFCQKNVPSYIFSPHWLYGNTVPFFSWHPSWCLLFLCIPSPPVVTDRGCSDTLGQNRFALGGGRNTHSNANWKLFFFGEAWLCFHGVGRESGECVWLKSRAHRCRSDGMCPSWSSAAPCLGAKYTEYFSCNVPGFKFLSEMNLKESFLGGLSCSFLRWLCF